MPVPPFPEQLRRYLDLTNDQVDKLQSLIADYNRLVSVRTQRVMQVQQEIAAETAKDTLDPMALGVRYAEIEAIRRELTDQKKFLGDSERAVLTPPQQAKLKTLQDMIALLPVLNEAQCTNFVPLPPGGTPVPIAGVLLGIPAGIPASIGGLVGCGGVGFVLAPPGN